MRRSRTRWITSWTGDGDRRRPRGRVAAVVLALGVASAAGAWGQAATPSHARQASARLRMTPPPAAARASASQRTVVPAMSAAETASKLRSELLARGLVQETANSQGLQSQRSEAQAASALQRRIGQDVEARFDSGSGALRTLSGSKLHRGVTAAPKGVSIAQATAHSFLRANRGLVGLTRPERELALRQQQDIGDGRQRLRFQQQHHGLEVFGAEVSVYLDADGDVERFMGTQVPSPRRVPATPVFASASAVRVALEQVSASASARASEPELMVYAEKGVPPALAWKVEVNDGLLQSWFVAVDALSGRVLTHFNRVRQNADLHRHASASRATARGRDMKGQMQDVQVFQRGGQFIQIDTSRQMFAGGDPLSDVLGRGAIYTLDMENRSGANAEGVPNIELITQTSSLVVRGSTNNWGPPDAVSAGRNMARVYEYYRQRFGRNSIDDQGISLFNFVRIGWDGPGGLNNAFNLGTTMIFGNGDRWPEALDIVAHEMTHGVIGYTADLVYQGESGALNESWADVLGESAEAFFEGGTDWLSGGDLIAGPGRSFRNPPAHGQPEHMNDFVITDLDNGGVHINSGITNKAFYLLAEGQGNSIGLNKAESIFYRALTTYLQKRSGMADARDACVAAARDLFGAGSTEANATASAFSAVGLGQATNEPPAPEVPAVSGQDSVLFSVFSQQQGGWFLGRREPSLGDPNQGVLLVGPITPVPAQVTGDGSLAFVVGADADACFVDTRTAEPSCLGFPGQIYSVAMSPTGLQYAFVFQDAEGNPTQDIGFIDLGTEQTEIFPLRIPAPDAPGAGLEPLFASQMVFTGDGRFLFYDAVTPFKVGNETVGVWSLFGLDLATGAPFSLVAPSPDFQISRPSLSNTSDLYITFDAFFPADNETVVVTGNLLTGDLFGAVLVSGGFAGPVFNGNDRAVMFTAPDQNAPSGFVLGRQNLAPDHLNPTGNPQLWLSDGALPAVYRRGNFTAPTQGCVASDTVLCISDNRFAVEVFWETPQGNLGPGRALKLTADTGYFWFFDVNNVEIVIKALNACPVNGRFWIFAGGLTDVRATIRISDTLSGSVREFKNPKRTPFLPIQTTRGFSTCSLAKGAPVAASASGVEDRRVVLPQSAWPDELPRLGGQVAALGSTAVVADRGVAGEPDEASWSAEVPSAAGANCNPAQALCLGGGRFEVRSTYRTAQGAQGNGVPIALTRDTGYFWFFDQANVEVVVKVLDGCALNNRYWVFAAGLTDVRVDLTVTDREKGRMASYRNRLGQPFQPIQDTDALRSCP